MDEGKLVSDGICRPLSGYDSPAITYGGERDQPSIDSGPIDLTGRQMESRAEIVEAAPLTGSLEVPEGLREALIGGRGQEGSTLVDDLPTAIVCSILSRISNPFDVAAAFRASRVFWGLARSAPFRLRLRPSRYLDTGAFGDDQGSPNRYVVNDLKAVVQISDVYF